MIRMKSNIIIFIFLIFTSIFLLAHNQTKKGTKPKFHAFQIFYKFLLEKSAMPAISSWNFPGFIKFFDIVYQIIKDNRILRN